MSFGKNKQSSSQTFDPQLKNALLSVFQSGQQVAKTPYQPYNFATVAPMSPMQLLGMQRGVDAANQGIGRQQLADAIASTQGVANFIPSEVKADSIGALGLIPTASYDKQDTSYDPRSFSASLVREQKIKPKDIGMDRIGPLSALTADRVQSSGVSDVRAQPLGPREMVQNRDVRASTIGADQVRAGQFSQRDVAPYMNQYENQVVNRALGDIERARQMQRNQDAASAQRAGAFGGDRHGVVDALTNEAFAKQAADTSAQLRSQGFDRASQLAVGDINRTMTADQSNQGANLQARLGNQQAGLTADTGSAQRFQSASADNARINQARNMAMQDANLRAQLANQAAQGQTQGRNLTAQQLNQAANLQAGQFNRSTDLTRQQLNQATRQAMDLANQKARLQAQTTNVGNNMQAQQLNQDAQIRTGIAAQQAQQAAMAARNQGMLANQDAALRAQLANQQASLTGRSQDLSRQQSNQDAALRAALANQQAGLSTAAQRLAGAQQLGQLGQDLRGLNFADAQALQQIGQQQQQFGQTLLDDQYRRFLEQRDYPIRMFDVLRGAAGILPNPLTSSSSGRSTSFGLG